MTVLRRDVPKLLGCYESQLQALPGLPPYDTALDAGCGEGWYVVGLALFWPGADVHGFDISPLARSECWHNAELNWTRVNVHGAATPQAMGSMVRGRTLLVVDAEGAEVDVLQPEASPHMRPADVLVEMHDFLVAGPRIWFSVGPSNGQPW